MRIKLTLTHIHTNVKSAYKSIGVAAVLRL